MPKIQKKQSTGDKSESEKLPQVPVPGFICGTTIGEYAFIGAGAVVNKDVKPYALMVGVPARQIGWMSEFGEQIPLPVEGQGQHQCSHTGQRYELAGKHLKRGST